jgi:hypothetical protein
VITHFEPSAVRWEGERPAAVGDQELAVPTRIVRTAAGFWGIYARGEEVLIVFPGGAISGPTAEVRERLRALADDQGRDASEREAASSFLPYLGDDDPGAAGDVPRSRAADAPPPTYRLSDPTNSPPNPMPPSGGPEHPTEAPPA